MAVVWQIGVFLTLNRANLGLSFFLSFFLFIRIDFKAHQQVIGYLTAGLVRFRLAGRLRNLFVSRLSAFGSLVKLLI